jgi:hypothetical protein
MRRGGGRLLLQAVLIPGRVPIGTKNAGAHLCGRPLRGGHAGPPVSGSQAPAWEPHCRQSSCFVSESSIYGAMRPKQELGGNLRSQAGAWERGKGGMRGAFPPYGLRATSFGLLRKRPLGRASAPAAVISRWCVGRTLRKTLNLEP